MRALKPNWAGPADGPIVLRSKAIGFDVDRLIDINTDWRDMDAGAGIKYRFYAIVDTNNDSYGDSILAFTDNGAAFSVAAVDTGWATNPVPVQIGAGIDSERARWTLVASDETPIAIYCVCREGTTGTLFKLRADTGAAYGAGWANPSDSFDELAVPVGYPSQYLLVCMTGDNQDEVSKVTRSNGANAGYSNCGSSQKNYSGCFISGYEPFWTAPHDAFAYSRNSSNMGIYAPGWWGAEGKSVSLDNDGSDGYVPVTDSVLSVRMRSRSRYVYGSCGWYNSAATEYHWRVFKLARDTGQYAADADASGEEWYDMRLAGGRITTPITGASDRRVILFGTDGGFLYILNDNNAFPAVTPAEANPVYTGLGHDGSPVPGFPYRIVGGELLSMTAQGSGNGTRIMFVVGQSGQVKLYTFQLP